MSQFAGGTARGPPLTIRRSMLAVCRAGRIGWRNVEPVPESDPPVEVCNPDDDIVLAPAIAAEAEILITGDKDFFDVTDQVGALRIMTPRTFWEEVR